MNQLYDFIVQLFYQLANAFFYPVAFALLALFAYSLLDLGRLLFAVWRRRQDARTDLPALARALARRFTDADWETTDETDAPRGLPADVPVSSSVRQFWTRVEERLRDVDSTEDIDLWLDETLRGEEIKITSRLDRSRAFVRIGPMLGLAGTIIPLGPALQELLAGNMAGMVNHLVVGFGAVVCGLVLSGIAYYVTLVRERWARVDIKEMEDLAELLMRNLRRREKKLNEQGQQPKEAEYASVRSA